MGDPDQRGMMRYNHLCSGQSGLNQAGLQQLAIGQANAQRQAGFQDTALMWERDRQWKEERAARCSKEYKLNQLEIDFKNHLEDCDK